ncbi:hypothetical protein [Bdellovibrio bacteriovorus]|nr:hypothetical protein [Bdellovibrio bacteriovorus]
MKIKQWFKDTLHDFISFGSRQKFVLGTFFALFALSYVAGHFLIMTTDPYGMSVQFLRDDKVLSQYVGKITYRSLKPLSSSIRVKHTLEGSQGDAKITIDFYGDCKGGEANFFYSMKDGKWELLKAHALTSDHDVIILKQHP